MDRAPAVASERRSEVAEGDRGRAVSVGKLKGPHANEVGKAPAAASERRKAVAEGDRERAARWRM
jgi:hypothetical protein